ncbi:MAG: hypothetical protein CLLPBCKN_001244 [Chroococcidiopsis cubana SAG 39.79]|uniref:Uncharacterized protein n=2 Tax=Chroococcidiopsis TaxID=54298 RepID=K9TZU2_CHRTP|nr:MULTISPECIES: hypothetical protein [Chroococcidiopsis]AFY88332.1 hypothetical protein Chro_2863 [Chroococcidiopsis thermalis PCC 7203]MDZ4871856.1 hypothetical protein [Chroococcidiopsis cubana SAG 39.79]RUT10802.1 hypothetical protein DSM107010_39200 [Chroococcidiopsis cubana SAG 39.79]URD47631.1 hypothetical protein M5J74_14945 [Chroococcidiopsis sp. CCNUC1]
MRKKWRSHPIFVSLCVCLGFATEAWADQCAYVSKEQALAAVSRLQVGQTIYQLCEPCGDRIPNQIAIQDLAAATTGSQDYWEVRVNGANVDLAYIFVDNEAANQKINLAVAVGCPARDVSVVLPEKKPSRRPAPQRSDW